MPAATGPALKARKSPVQARSSATVEAIFEATIQVLLNVGYRRLTTTRVAERAGVSVGTLYQYFPNRQALLAAMMRRSLDELAETLIACCEAARGRPADVLATELVDAYLDLKLERPNLALALREPIADVGGAQMMAAASARITGALASALKDCPDLAFEDSRMVASVLVASAGALVHQALEAGGGEAIRAEAHALVAGYLRQTGTPRRAS